MPHHLELRYWFNGVRRCDIYPEGHKGIHAEVRRLTTMKIPCRLATVCCTHDVIAEYRDIKKGTVVAEPSGNTGELKENGNVEL